jgi:MFS family permease
VAFIRAPLLPDIGRDLDMSPTALGALIAAFALGRIITDVPAGRLTDRRPARPMLAIGAIVAALGSLAGGLAPTSGVAFVASFVLGVGSAWTNTTGIAAFAEAPRERRGVAMSGFAAALMVGQAIGPTVGGVVASIWDWRAAFLAGAAIGLTVAAILALSSRGGPAIEHGASTGAVNQVGATTLLALYLLPAAQFGVAAALIQTLVPIVGDGELALSVGTIGLAIGLGGLLRLVGALASGQVSDRYSRRWALFPGLAFQLVALVVFAVGSSVATWWVAIILYSLGSSTVNVGATVLADLSEGGGLGRRLGVFRLTGDAALLVAPLAGGALYEAFGRFWASLPLIGFIVCVIVLAFVAIPETVGTRS